MWPQPILRPTKAPLHITTEMRPNVRTHPVTPHRPDGLQDDPLVSVCRSRNSPTAAVSEHRSCRRSNVDPCDQIPGIFRSAAEPWVALASSSPRSISLSINSAGGPARIAFSTHSRRDRSSDPLCTRPDPQCGHLLALYRGMNILRAPTEFRAPQWSFVFSPRRLFRIRLPSRLPANRYIVQENVTTQFHFPLYLCRQPRPDHLRPVSSEVTCFVLKSTARAAPPARTRHPPRFAGTLHRQAA